LFAKEGFLPLVHDPLVLFVNVEFVVHSHLTLFIDFTEEFTEIGNTCLQQGTLS
jgi:hypothetical protein